MPRPTSSAPSRLAKVAARQHGLFTRGQARWCGYTDHQVDRRLATGSFVALRPGVLGVAGAPATWEQSVMSAVLAAGEGAMASGATALRVWEVSPRPSHSTIHVLTPSEAKRARRPGITGHRTTIITTEDVRRRHGISVVSPARALVDCAGELGVDGLGAALDDALRRRLLTLEAMRATTARLMAPGRPHRRVTAEVLARRLPGYDPGDSDLEVEALTRIRRAGLPIPVQQHPVVVRGRRLHLDLAYPELEVAIELDGWEWHRHRTAFDRDRHRTSWLAADGWAVLVTTSETIDDLVPQLQALIPRRVEHLRAG